MKGGLELLLPGFLSTLDTLKSASFNLSRNSLVNLSVSIFLSRFARTSPFLPLKLATSLYVELDSKALISRSLSTMILTETD